MIVKPWKVRTHGFVKPLACFKFPKSTGTNVLGKLSWQQGLAPVFAKHYRNLLEAWPYLVSSAAAVGFWFMFPLDYGICSLVV